MDNRIFNVNGKGDAMLLRTLQLVFEQSSHVGCCAWKQTIEHGLILYWYASSDEKANQFPSYLSAQDVLPIAKSWLGSDFAAKVESSNSWDKDADHDGSNSSGWRVYCEDWGHVGGSSSAICAIRPVVLWHGK